MKNCDFQKIVIVRSLPGLGDLLCIVPALRALRAALPEADITLLGLNEAKAFVQRFSNYLDHWLGFPGYLGIPEVGSATQVMMHCSDG
jgi:ADP-heptose:LPS heptosyltransferase